MKVAKFDVVSVEHRVFGWKTMNMRGTVLNTGKDKIDVYMHWRLNDYHEMGYWLDFQIGDKDKIAESIPRDQQTAFDVSTRVNIDSLLRYDKEYVIEYWFTWTSYDDTGYISRAHQVSGESKHWKKRILRNEIDPYDAEEIKEGSEPMTFAQAQAVQSVVDVVSEYDYSVASRKSVTKAVMDALQAGATPWSIRKTLQAKLFPLSHLDTVAQEALGYTQQIQPE